MSKFTTFVELCAMLDDKSFMYHHVMDGKEVVSTTVAYHDGKTTIQTSMRAPMIQSRNFYVDPPIGVQYTPTCSASTNCVVIIDQYKPTFEFLLRIWPSIQKTIVSVNRRVMSVIDREKPECVSVLKAALQVRMIQAALARVICFGPYAVLDKKHLDIVNYTIDKYDRRIYEISGVVFTEEDLSFIDKIKNNYRVRGFIKTPRGLQIQWGLPCRPSNTQDEILALLNRSFDPSEDQFYCAATCS